MDLRAGSTTDRFCMLPFGAGGCPVPASHAHLGFSSNSGGNATGIPINPCALDRYQTVDRAIHFAIRLHRRRCFRDLDACLGQLYRARAGEIHALGTAVLLGRLQRALVRVPDGDRPFRGWMQHHHSWSAMIIA
jgi:hypothetical protein